ncbi:MAG: recombinase family protein [bacterium]|nr:recombinase family protein [bacterium]
MPSIVIYARKSTESEDRQILSIDSQVRELQAFAAKADLSIDAVYIESMSAKAPGRPVFKKLLQLVGTGKIQGVLCWKLDRLARNPVDGGALIWAMEVGKLSAIHTPQRSFSNTGNDKFWMQLEFGMAKKYVDDLSDNVKRGLRAKIDQGWVPGLPPIGYTNDRNTRTIVKDPERFPLVRKMWDLMLTGSYTPRKILSIATEQWGLRTRKHKRIGGGPLQYSTVYKVFTNPFYYGAIRYGGDINPGGHAAMITKSEFDRVQELLGLRKWPRPKRHEFTYTGLIKCGECGAAVTAEHKTNRYGRKYVYYHCSHRKRSVKCSQRSITDSTLESQVREFLSSLRIGAGIRDWSLKLLREFHEEECLKGGAALASLHSRYEACVREIGELVNMRLRELLTDSEYRAKKAELEEERFRLKELLDDNDARNKQVLLACEDTFDFAQRAMVDFENGTPELKRAILVFTGSNLTLMNGKLLIEPQKPLQMIQTTLLSQAVEKLRFESQILSLVKRKTDLVAQGISEWCGLVRDIRTFYKQNRGVATFEQTVQRISSAGLGGQRWKQRGKERVSTSALVTVAA